MQQQSTVNGKVNGKKTHPGRLDVLFHGIKTFKLMRALVMDPRIPIIRKVFFFGALAALAVVLIFPDLLGEFVLSTVLPLVGTVLGVPLDAGFDWLAFGLVVVSLLRVFPPELVAEHYREIFF
jgi:hypothetical protein